MRCPICGVVARLVSGACMACGAAHVREASGTATLTLTPVPEAVVLVGTLVEDRAPESPAPGPGLAYAPVPRRVPWLDLLVLLALASIVTNALQVVWYWPGWVIALLFLAPLLLLGALRRWQPARWEALRGRLGPALRGLAGRRPQIRRVVVWPDGVAQPVGVEIAFPDRWPPSGERPAVEGRGPAVRVRCEGGWLEPGVLLCAARITVVDAQGRALARPVRASAWQRFPLALGVGTLLLVVGAVLAAAFR